MSNTIKNITLTIIFEGSALNRDEKMGGNILSIKKLNVNGETKSFLSKVAIRHYLFETLHRAFPQDWKPAELTTGQNVIQFDLTRDDIITSAEIDAFGYMYTISGESSITRKAPVGITKAISIYNYQQDLAFYANHELVKRANEKGLNTNPNPYNKEEHTSLYKLSCTIDSEIFGTDRWIIKQQPVLNVDKLIIEIEKPQKAPLKNVDLANEDDKEFYLVNEGNKKYRLYVDGCIITAEKMLFTKKKDKKSNNEYLTIKSSFLDKSEKDEQELLEGKKKKEKEFSILNFEEMEEFYRFTLSREPKYDSSKKQLILETGIVKIIENTNETNANEYEYSNGKLKIEKINDSFLVTFLSKIKDIRIKQILDTIKNGLYAQSSGEVNTIVPLFMIASGVRVPSPIFHPYIDVRKENYHFEIIGLKDCLRNEWINSDKIFLMNIKKFKINVSDNRLTNDWNEFLKDIGLI